MEKARVAVIGLGHQSIEDHIPAVMNSRDTVLVAVLDIEQGRLDDFHAAHPEIATYSNLDQLFQEEKLDFVIIAVPHHAHFEVTMKALENNVHVMKEKPLAVNIEQAVQIYRMAQEKHREVMLTLQRRFNPIYNTFTQIVDKIGHPYFVQCRYTLYTATPQEGWRGKNELAGGGCLIDMGYHMVDLLMWYFGLPNRVVALTSCAAIEEECYDAEDTAQLLFSYEDKSLMGSLLVSRVMPPKEETIDVYGTRGIIHLERGQITRFDTSGEMQESLKRENSWPSAALDQIECFVKIIRGERMNMNNPESHLAHLAFIEAAYQSRIHGRMQDPHTLLSNISQSIRIPEVEGERTYASN